MPGAGMGDEFLMAVGTTPLAMAAHILAVRGHRIGEVRTGTSQLEIDTAPISNLLRRFLWLHRERLTDAPIELPNANNLLNR
jgi:hypothetical protein